MLGAFMLEWISNSLLAGTGIFMPWSALAFCLVSWRMEFEMRLWFALIIGLIMDTIRLVPFGALLLTCVLSALLCEVFRVFFSNTESRITQSVSVVLLMLMFLGMVPWWVFVLGKFIS